MVTILSILQILGIILLVLLGILLFVSLVILFVPIRYKIYGKTIDDIYIKCKATWLLHFIRAYISYENNSIDTELKILWKKISFTKKKDEPKEIEEEQSPNTSYNFFEKIKLKVLHLKKKASQIKKIIQDEKNKKAFKHLKEELYYLVKILLPKKSRLEGIFSTGSPNTTGQLFGVICCFPIIYQDNWTLTPDFESEKAYFQGEFQGKGRIYVFQLIGIILRIVFDKNCRRLYYIINRLGGKNNGRRK